MSYRHLLASAALITVATLLLQLLVGTDVSFALLIAVAVGLGFSAVFVAGIKSALGLLSLLLVCRYLIIAILLKVIALQEPVERGLEDPVETSLVMVAGFGGLLVSACTLRLLSNKFQVYPKKIRPQQFLALTFVLMILGYGSWLMFRASGDETTVGGLWGITKSLSSFGAISIVTAMLYAWQSGKNRFFTHPLVLFTLFEGIGIGVLSTGKQAMAEPMLFYILMGFLRYGFRSKTSWSLSLLSVLLFATLIYPYSQYIRYQGGRNPDLAYAATQILDVSWRMITDREFRESVQLSDLAATQPSVTTPYLSSDLRWADRFALISAADRLIAASNRSESLLGWGTIIAGFELVTPQFIFPNKRQNSTGNDLGYLTGDINSDDETTQVSYGFFANLYASFGLIAVFFGTVVIVTALFLWFQLFWGRLIWPSFWTLLVVFSCQQLFVEGAVAHLINFLRLPIIFSVPWLLAVVLVTIIFPRSFASSQYRKVTSARVANTP